MLLTIDVGNTCTGAAVFDKKNIIFKNKLSTPIEISERFLKNLIKSEYRGKINNIIISSVVPLIDKSLSISIKKLFEKGAFFIDFKTDTGIKLKIDNPEEMGADRIADSVGALHFFKPPFIIIDSGTATTFDIINENYEYIGGSIFPGIDISIKSLANNTAKLNKINFKIPDSIIGTNTEESIKAGIFYSYIGGLNFMIYEYKKIVGNKAKVIVTGGLIKYFKHRIKKIDLYEPDLIYYGLNIINERISKQ
jgi:type III pantothenate kinase